MEKNQLLLSGGFSPNIRVAMDHKTQHPFRIKKRVIFDYEFLYMAQGSLDVVIQEQHHAVNRGDILILRPGIPHSMLSTSTGLLHMPHIHLDLMYYDDFDCVYTSFKDLDMFSEEDKKLIRPDLLECLGFPLPNVISVSSLNKVLQTFLDIIKVHTNGGAFFKIKEHELFSKIFYIIFKEVHISLNKDMVQHRKSIQNIKEQLDESPEVILSLKQYAKQACISEFHLERLFKKAYGQPIYRYHMKRKMDKAVELLLYSKMSVTSIATMLGYSNIHSFSKSFKNTFGISPLNYIKRSNCSETTIKD